MSNFPGLCIGGPMDGKLYECASPSFQMARFSGRTVDDFTYIHVQTEEGVHFWIPAGETPTSILTTLAVHYMTTKILQNG